MFGFNKTAVYKSDCVFFFQKEKMKGEKKMKNKAVSAVMIATEYKTVSQIAAEMGVSKQAAYQKLESRRLKEALKPHIAYDYKGVMRFDEGGVRLIESTFKTKPLKYQLAELKEELAIKDALIAKLSRNCKYTNYQSRKTPSHSDHQAEFLIYLNQRRIIYVKQSNSNGQNNP